METEKKTLEPFAANFGGKKYLNILEALRA
jgi:hypothetical protein